MTVDEKMDGLKDQTTGKVKEVSGAVTGDTKTEVEGKAEGLLGKAKNAASDLKEKATDVVEDVKEKFDK